VFKVKATQVLARENLAAPPFPAATNPTGATMRGKICSVASFKGGVGKTTTLTNLAHHAALQRLRACIIDCDAQGNASKAVAKDGWKQGNVLHAHELFENRLPTTPPLVVTPYLSLVLTKGGDPKLRHLDRVATAADGYFSTNVRHLAERYDIVFIDTPPSMSRAMEAPLLAADFAYSPICLEEFSTDNLPELLAEIDRVRKRDNPGLDFLGLLVNRVKQVDLEQLDILNGLRKDYGRLLIPHSLPESAPISRIRRHQVPLWLLATSGAERKAAAAIKGFGDWMLERMLGKKPSRGRSILAREKNAEAV
jgi:chromosome partitioning protein